MAALLAAGCGDNLSSCPAPAVICDGVCVDTQTHLEHCGGCNTACPDRPNAAGVCAAGGCDFVCDAGFSDCDGDPANGCENPTPSCGEYMCADARDNDGDDLIDCNDDDCAGQPTCVACPGGDIGAVTGDALVTGTTIGRADDYPSTPGCGSADSSGEDDAFVWRAPADGCYVIDSNGSEFDTVVRVHDACGGSELSCDDSSGVGLQSSLRHELVADEQVVVVIDGASRDAAGPYVLNINYAAAMCVERACADGMDNDGDSDIDCDDDDCRYDAACYESICDDVQDNDSDGLADCADPDCAAAPSCYESMCDDGVDNEGDGAIDCADSECFADPACAAVCPNLDLGVVTGDSVIAGPSAGTGDDFAATPGCGSAGGEDVAFTWQAPEGGCYRFDTDRASYNTVLRVYDSCDGSELACNDGGDGVQSWIRHDMAAGEQVVVIVDGHDSGASGTYALDINRVAGQCAETQCADTVDEDNDGLADCSDSDCAFSPACYESVCDDGLDNDGDDATDCADPDCAMAPSCYESVCDDGLDNDSDAASDCGDTDCFADPACASLCPNLSLGTATGDGLIAGASAGTGDDFASTPGCGSATSSGEDVAFSWQAPVDGCYAFDTDDASYDTVLRLYDTCGGSELACDDNSGAGSRSLIRRDLGAGEQVVVVVDGYSSYSSGEYALDINRVSAQCAETRCADGADDDGDSAVDCADSDCALDPACYETSCTDAVDNDSDGAVDCADTECFADPACAGMCPNLDLGMATGDGLVAGSNAGTGDDFASSSRCGSETSSGEDVAFAWQAPAGGCFLFDTDSSDYDTVLRLYSACDGSELRCDDDDGLGLRSMVRREMTAGEELVVIVDGYSSAPGSTGNYVLDIHPVPCTEQTCDNGLDDDGDTDIDCDDDDCAGDAACP